MHLAQQFLSSRLSARTHALLPRSWPLNDLTLLLATGVLTGAMNALGGGGSFVALPALMALGVPSIAANASTTVALLPGGWVSAWTYRHDLRRFTVAPVAPMLTTSALGGWAGAVLLLATPTHAFDATLPWLVLTATLTFALGRKAANLRARAVHVTTRRVLIVQLILALYAGYFGGGVGIMMMSAWTLLRPVEAPERSADVLAMQAARMVMVTAANGLAAVWFAISGAVAWPQTLTVMVAGLAGGYAGAQLTLRLRPDHVRNATVVLGLLISAVLFMRSR